MEKKLQVKDLTISFKTTDGKVQAVRGIDFDLYKGETLAIVGESGSGKSVTSKAILGILAGNSIVENGEIIYDGKDLLKISEDEFHEIRGDKIAMIFQDPMSSLNPIIRIGRQLTEAMILKGKARQKESRKTFNGTLKLLEESMIEAYKGDSSVSSSKLSKMCKDFDRFEYKHLDLESAYNEAYEAASECAFNLKDILFEIEKKGFKDEKFRLNEVVRLSAKSIQTYVVNEKANELKGLIGKVKAAKNACIKSKDYSAIVPSLEGIKSILDEAVAFTAPNFFAMGYYQTYSKEKMPELPVSELNVFLRKYLDDNFMLDFIEKAKKGIMLSASKSDEGKKRVLSFFNDKKSLFEKEVLDEKEIKAFIKEVSPVINESIDKLELVKDSLAYTFVSGMTATKDKYFKGIKTNTREQARYTKEKNKYDKLVAKGKTPEKEVVPAAIVDLEALRQSMIRQMDRLSEHYNQCLDSRAAFDFDAATVAMIDFLKAKASGVVNKVTKAVAKTRAIKLMEEVGIAEPRRRYKQYPFEFSGGMRQRIVIAIALAADPDILICDEPTTALDVTIQSQILELINDLKKRKNLTVIFITHDLGVVANMADRIAVMYAGKIVEYGTAEDVFYDSRHPYTWALLSSMPDLDTNEKLDAIPGTPPNMIYPPVGDAFAARNKYAMKIDYEQQPPMFKVSDTHYAATWLLHPNAPKIEKPKCITDRIERMKERGANNE